MAFTSNHQIKKNKLTDTDPWVWLLEMRHTTTEAFRITNYTQQVTYDSNIFYPYPFEISDFQDSTDSNNSNLRLTVANIGGELQALLDANDGFADVETVLMLLDSANISDGPAREILYRVVGSTATWSSVEFELGSFDLFAKDVPRRKWVRNSCQWPYRNADGTISDLCGYQETSTGAGLATCDKTLFGANGCRAHGNDEVANGFIRLHPKRYGAQPGIPANRQ